MSFISLEYLLLLPITFLLYFALPHRYRTLLLLFSSYLFYSFAKVEYLLIIFFSTSVDYLCALGINATKIQERKKVLLFLSVFINLGLLSIFKYTNFFLTNVETMANIFHPALSFPRLGYIIPIGISFYTFQTIGYTIDVYRGRIKAERNFFTFALYVSFFPQLVAGPIERAETLIHQLKEQRQFDLEKAKKGLLQLVWGLFKKIVIADNLAIIGHTYIKNSHILSGFYAWVGATSLCILLYADFSGYSDIAIGSARLFGINLRRNFAHPFGANSMREFWKRWHMSLTEWFGDNLFRPLLSVPFFRKFKALTTIIVFTTIGLWHGAAWNYVLFGLFHGLFLVIEHGLSSPVQNLLLKFKISKNSLGIKIIISIEKIFLWIFIGLIFFTPNISDLAQAIPKLFQLSRFVIDLKSFANILPSNAFFNTYSLSSIQYFIISCFFLFVLKIESLEFKNGQEWIYQKIMPYFWALILVFTLVIVYFGRFNQTSFIYFQF